ncbi:M23 family metallopeptidase [Kitasatospora sp. MAP5-34]|uniref:M23 family metallopeptidase n=1 Tax=Kitasatospora sp. MAP5-34 TaxID=3035102 RepID=UPI0024759EB5|nr:M23 family metallopeptidase [Kitasatospora sp. MAP5-34]
MTTKPTPAPTPRSRRRDQNRVALRSAVLTVALPSVATLGVFAAAAMAGTHPAAPTGATSPASPAESPGPDEVADRAARDQLRPDLVPSPQSETPTDPQTAPKPPEPVRPALVLPVDLHGLSATYGEVGNRWRARHTGIDFPVPMGTPVHAVTDGTVSVRWNSAYGWMAAVTSAAVTSADGTKTWYCHLGSYRVRKGQVHAGDVIAYSGSSGNSTGPHLHFEVHPGGAGPVDPLPWLIARGLDPR